MAVDIEKLEELIRSGDSAVMVSRGWLRAIIAEIRDNRKQLATLRKQLAERPERTSTPKTDFEFPQREFDETMGFFDKTMDSMARMFRKL